MRINHIFLEYTYVFLPQSHRPFLSVFRHVQECHISAKKKKYVTNLKRNGISETQI